MPEYPRETIEFQRVDITDKGVAVTSGVQFALSQPGERAGEFSPAVILEGHTGFMISGMAPGTYRVWWKIVGNPQSPVDYLEEYLKIT